VFGGLEGKGPVSLESGEGHRAGGMGRLLRSGYDAADAGGASTAADFWVDTCAAIEGVSAPVGGISTIEVLCGTKARRAGRNPTDSGNSAAAAGLPGDGASAAAESTAAAVAGSSTEETELQAGLWGAGTSALSGESAAATGLPCDCASAAAESIAAAVTCRTAVESEGCAVCWQARSGVKGGAFARGATGTAVLTGGAGSTSEGATTPVTGGAAHEA
jgi:hypothetical protein